MSLTPLHYRVVGQDDYMLDISVDSAGAYRIDCGDHTSHTPRQGQLNEVACSNLQALIDTLGAPREHPAPEGTTGFVATLSVGSPPEIRRYRIWEGALEQEPDILALVRALEVI
ncbi:hypothetical protein [Thiocystis violacea]|uniref:hypothetical protein n=1 Tax=Thiocystis violacea TaxID=13725 RepID=UPI001907AA37|nr:hypothetical protein [Thiocystis violacea]MBK1721457.1 hypothetical protein [Thiocystis violacea]